MQKTPFKACERSEARELGSAGLLSIYTHQHAGRANMEGKREEKKITEKEEEVI